LEFQFFGGDEEIYLYKEGVAEEMAGGEGGEESDCQEGEADGDVKNFSLSGAGWLRERLLSGK